MHVVLYASGVTACDARARALAHKNIIINYNYTLCAATSVTHLPSETNNERVSLYESTHQLSLARILTGSRNSTHCQKQQQQQGETLVGFVSGEQTMPEYNIRASQLRSRWSCPSQCKHSQAREAVAANFFSPYQNWFKKFYHHKIINY
jgi:hypothetical protein